MNTVNMARLSRCEILLSVTCVAGTFCYLCLRAGDKLSVHRLFPKQDLHGLDPRAVDFILAHSFIAIAKVRTNEPNDLLKIPSSNSPSQISNGHKSHLQLTLSACRYMCIRQRC